MNALKEAVQLVEDDRNARLAVCRMVAEHTGKATVTEAEAAEHLNNAVYGEAQSLDESYDMAKKMEAEWRNS